MNYIQENIKSTIDFTLNIMALSIEDENIELKCLMHH